MEDGMSQMTFVPYGTNAPAGKYACIDCGYKLTMKDSGPLPPCPRAHLTPHEKRGWEVTAGDAAIGEQEMES